jgi:trigger factor
VKVSAESLGNCQTALTIEAEDSELSKSLDEAYHHLVKEISVPGFRKGKTPRDVLVQHIGKKNLLDDALEHLIPQLYRQAIDSQQLTPIAQPQIEITQTEPVIFRALVSVQPEIKLGDYHSIRLEPPPDTIIGEEEIAAAMEQIREKQGVWMPVERPVELRDLVTMDIEASVGEKPWLNHKGILFEVDKDSRSPVPGFASHLEGVEKGKDKSFSVTIPDDYPIKEVAGKEGAFKVGVTEIKEKQLPEIDDKLVKSAGYDNLEDMKTKLTDDLRARAEVRNRLELRQKALDSLVEMSEVNYPPVLEDEEIVGLLRDEAQRFGFKDVADYVEKTSKTEEELKQALQPVAKKRLTQGLVLGKLAEAEKIEVSASEVDNKIDDIANDAEDKEKEKTRQFFSLPQVRQSIEQSLLTQKTMDRLLEMAVGSANNVAKEE